MRIIVVSKRHGRTRSFTMGGWARAVVSACLVGIPVSAALFFKYFDSESAPELISSDATKFWVEALSRQETEVKTAKAEAEQKLSALTLRVAELQGRLMRLDALGERITSMANLDKGEFNFSDPPAVGGPELSIEEVDYSPPDFRLVLNNLETQIQDRQQQLETLEELLANRKLLDDVFVAGRPIKKGWMSSRYGRRSDPFSGRVAWHAGVDFAGREGADIVAVASGVVTWADHRNGYGTLVEINHGNGFKTRYGHCKDSLVKVGDVVKKGQVIALMGTSGRSTGPHVHFEVYKNGRTVDPSAYIHRTSR
ncbi:MAG: M23 family metallopeptidase [Cellvibrionaceae bacterium]|nr:M23 family metallopeptidase [Cellvibrionaceae bacterium]